MLKSTKAKYVEIRQVIRDSPRALLVIQLLLFITMSLLPILSIYGSDEILRVTETMDATFIAFAMLYTSGMFAGYGASVIVVSMWTVEFILDLIDQKGSHLGCHIWMKTLQFF